MHNSRSLLGGIKFHLSGSVEARANLCRAAPSGVTHVCIVRAWGISDNAGQPRLLGVMARLILYAYMSTCLHTNKHIQKRRPTSVYPVHVTGKPYRNNRSLLMACRCRPKL